MHTSVLENAIQWILGLIVILSSLGVILVRKPVHASLSFLLALVTLSALYLQLAAEFIAVMQILVYAGAILVIFMFVIVLFQDAHEQLAHFKPQSNRNFLIVAGVLFSLCLLILARNYLNLPLAKSDISPDFGSVQTLGTALYVDFFFPFEAIIFLFLTALVGALYVAKKVK